MLNFYTFRIETTLHYVYQALQSFVVTISISLLLLEMLCKCKMTLIDRPILLPIFRLFRRVETGFIIFNL